MFKRDARRVGRFFLVAAALFAAACGRSSPTGPSSPSPAAQYSESPATVNSVMPAALAATGNVQTIIVVGSNFKPGLEVDIAPLRGEAATSSGAGNHAIGGSIHVSGSAIQSVTDTSFEALVTVQVSGSYQLSVTNPSAPPSSAVSVTAKTCDAPRPTITGVSPRAPVQSSASQVLSVSGTNFQAGLSVALTAPSGATTTIGGGAITNVTATDFRLSVTLADIGTYKLRVSNPGTQISEPLTFTVTTPPPPPPKPVVTGTSPSAPTASSGTQLLYFAGSNFENGLTVSLTVPNGTTSTFTGSAVYYFSATSCKIIVALVDAGRYAVRVTNPSGQSSEPYTFTVSAPEPPAKPTLTGVSSGTPTASGSAQLVYFSGTNFESGLTVALTRPNGATSTVSAGDIHYFSTTSFKIAAVLTDAGSYTIRVTNPSGASSDPFTFAVNPPLPPKVTAVSSGPPTASGTAQLVYFSGTNFESGLTVALMRPNGTTSAVNAGDIHYFSATSFKIAAVLADAGNYTIRVTNPSGLCSEAFTFAVKAGS